MSIPDITPLSARPFESRTDFEAHLLAAVQSAQREVWLADHDFSKWPLNHPDMESALHAFLLGSRANRLHVLTRSSGYLVQRAPRFTRLLRLFGHSIVCREVGEQVAARFSEEVSIALVDRARVVRRFHRDTMRGVAEFHPNDVGPSADRLFALWEEASPGLTATTLGLGA